jgi:hypothetical protein
MPMHDWTRVEPNDYHTFHYGWIATIYQTLNQGVLPEGYFAMADHTTPPIVPDVVTLSLSDQTADAASGGVALVANPSTSIAATESGRKKKLTGRWRVAIKHARSRRIVAVIEIVSPGNKAKKPEFKDLIDKSVQLLRQGIHVLLIDPFPPTARDPNGIHAAVWKDLTGKPFVPPPSKPLTLASYSARGENTFSAFVEPIAVGDILPNMPLFLAEQLHVPAPLEATYVSAWQGFPLPIRQLVEGS